MHFDTSSQWPLRSLISRFAFVALCRSSICVQNASRAPSASREITMLRKSIRNMLKYTKMVKHDIPSYTNLLRKYLMRGKVSEKISSIKGETGVESTHSGRTPQRITSAGSPGAAGWSGGELATLRVLGPFSFVTLAARELLQHRVPEPTLGRRLNYRTI